MTAGTCSSRIIFNVPDARSAGVELELAAQPTTFFDFAVSAGIADARLQSPITSTDDADAIHVVSGIEAGKRLPTTPRFQVAAAAAWRWLAGGRRLGRLRQRHLPARRLALHASGRPGAGLRFGRPDGAVAGAALGTFIGGPLTQSTFLFDPELPAYNILYTRIGFLDGRWEISFVLDNATDERAFLTLGEERGALTAPPRLQGRSPTWREWLACTPATRLRPSYVHHRAMSPAQTARDLSTSAANFSANFLTCQRPVSGTF